MSDRGEFPYDRLNGDGGRLRAYGDPPPTAADLMPPMNLEAERGVLGSVILDNSVMHDFADALAVEDFYRDSHQVVYRYVRAFYDAGKPFDVTLLADAISPADLNRVGGFEFLCELAQSVPHPANAKYYADIVRQKATSRKLVEFADKLRAAAYSNNHTAEKLVEMAETGVARIGERAAGEAPVWLGDATPLALARMEARRAGVKPGIPTGFAALDETLGGLEPGKLVVVAARPGMGKSALALQIAANVGSYESVTAGGEPKIAKALFVSLEMGADELTDRYLAFRSRVSGYAIKHPRILKPEQQERIDRATADNVQTPWVWIDAASGLTASQVCARARRHKARWGLDVLVVDYLQLLEASDHRANRQEQVAAMSRALKNLTTLLNVTVVCLSQLNRAVESREDRKPRMADLRESGAIEQDADVVVLMYRPDYYDPTDRPGETDVIVAKHRGGATGTVKLMFNPGQTRFHDAPRAEDVCPPQVLNPNF